MHSVDPVFDAQCVWPPPFRSEAVWQSVPKHFVVRPNRIIVLISFNATTHRIKSYGSPFVTRTTALQLTLVLSGSRRRIHGDTGAHTFPSVLKSLVASTEGADCNSSFVRRAKLVPMFTLPLKASKS